VGEKRAVSGAEVIETGLTDGCGSESILGALSVTRKTHRTFSTVPWKRVALSKAEPPLHSRCYEFDKRRFKDIAEQVV
jgi:hypothetical protein